MNHKQDLSHSADATVTSPGVLPLTRPELARRQREAETTGARVGPLVRGLAVLGIVLSCTALLEGMGRWWLVGLLLVGVVTIIGIVFAIKMRRRERAVGLSCPGCNAILARGLGELAITTGQCMKCGTVVATDEEGSSPRGTAMLPTRHVFAAGYEVFSERKALLCFYAIPSAITAVLVLLPLKEKHFIPARLGEGIILLLAALCGSVAVFDWLRNRRLAMEHGLGCMACGRMFEGNEPQIALATERCPRCGEHVFQKEKPVRLGSDAPNEDDTLFSQEEWRKRYARQGTASGIATGLLTLPIWLVLAFVAVPAFNRTIDAAKQDPTRAPELIVAVATVVFGIAALLPILLLGLNVLHRFLNEHVPWLRIGACPKCGGGPAERPSLRLMQTTGHCVFCGEGVVQDPGWSKPKAGERWWM
jgi:DNA-directed RNA polymerase subunit RPC12/RpoP